MTHKRRPRESTDILVGEITGHFRRFEPEELTRPLPPPAPVEVHPVEAPKRRRWWQWRAS
jgi:hypothetical protein